MWDVLFSAAYRLPCEYTKQLCVDLKYILPCTHCRRSYAAYIDRIKPADCIQNADDASKFLFTVHDFVNVKLGKQKNCIPYSIVAARHAVFTSVISWWDPLDMMALVALQLEEQPQAEAYARCAPILSKLAIAVGAPPSVLAGVEPDHVSPATAWLHSLKCRNNALMAAKLKPLSREEFQEHYSPCRAQLTPSTPKVSSRSHHRRK